jgi:peptide/nickel transport system substrate-binding protein
MKKLCGLLFVLGSLAVYGAAQGYVVQPVDAMILPLGEAGTDYADVSPGIRGGTLHVMCIEDPGGWNPYADHDTTTTQFTNRMFRGLLNLHPLTGELVPDMALSYEVSEDERVITFHLRRDIRWSDGVLFTAEDVTFTFNSLLNRYGDFPIVCEKIDNYTLAFTLDYPWRPILNGLSFEVLPKHALCQYFPEYNPAASDTEFLDVWTLDMDLKDLICSGPWIASDYKPGQSVTMTRNPYYYVYDSKGVQLPYFDEVVITIVSNRDEGVGLFLDGAIDCYAPRPEDKEFLVSREKEAGFSLIEGKLSGYGTTWVMLNQDFGLQMGRYAEKRTLYRDLLFRQALAHGVNKQALIEQVYHGDAVAQWSPVSIPSPFYAGRDEYAGPITEADAVIFEYDPSLSAQLLDELGVVDQDDDGWRDLPSGAALTINLATHDNTIRSDCAALLAEGWQDIGIHVVLRMPDYGLLVDSVYSSSYEMVLLGVTGGNEPNGGENIYSSCGNLHAFRYSACDDPTFFDRQVDMFLVAGATTLDLDLAFTHYKNYQRMVAENLDLIYLAVQSFNYAYYDYVGNVSLASPVATPWGNNGLFTELVFDQRLRK